MPALHHPPSLDHDDLDGLEGFDLAGRISRPDGELSYSKNELVEYLSLKNDSISLSKVIDHDHQLNCIVEVTIGQNRFVLLYHSTNFDLKPPTSAMPYVIYLYSSLMEVRSGSCISIFSQADAEYDMCRSSIQFLVENVIGNKNSWSFSSIARTFNVSNNEISLSGYGLLLSDAFRAGKLKYAYLDLFRCIEHKALRHAQDRFNTNFLNDPKGAAEEISNVVKSEKNLYSLVLGANSNVVSGAGKAIEELAASNSYISAVVSRIDNMPADQNAKSTHILYAVRNSIAHAKAGDLMVERFTDYEHALSRIVPYVEILALRFAGIELDASLT